MKFLMKWRKDHPNQSLKEAMKNAKGPYRKMKGGSKRSPTMKKTTTRRSPSMKGGSKRSPSMKQSMMAPKKKKASPKKKKSTKKKASPKRK